MSTNTMNKEIILILTAFVFLSTSAGADGFNSFTKAGTVASVQCFQLQEPPSPPESTCLVELETSAGAVSDSTQISCFDGVAEACRLLQPGDAALILGTEVGSVHQATHVALWLDGIHTRSKAGPRARVPRLGLGQRGTFEGLTIEFRAVTEDSRCPVDVDCIWAGEVTVAIDAWEGWTFLESFELTLGEDPETAERTVAGRDIRLIDVLPERRSGHPIDPSEYSIGLEVHQTPCDGSVWCQPVR